MNTVYSVSQTVVVLWPCWHHKTSSLRCCCHSYNFTFDLGLGLGRELGLVFFGLDFDLGLMVLALASFSASVVWPRLTSLQSAAEMFVGESSGCGLRRKVWYLAVVGICGVRGKRHYGTTATHSCRRPGQFQYHSTPNCYYTCQMNGVDGGDKLTVSSGCVWVCVRHSKQFRHQIFLLL